MPSIIVNSLDHAVAALECFRDAATDGFVLSPPGSGANLGAAVFQAMIDEARKHIPEARVTAVLDCGEDPGYALAAIRTGLKAIVFAGNAEAKSRISDIAQRSGCQIVDNLIYTDPQPLDLLDIPDTLDACRKYLAIIKDPLER